MVFILVLPHALLYCQVGGKYGINMQRDDLDGLKKIYGQYLEALIPSGDTQLK